MRATLQGKQIAAVVSARCGRIFVDEIEKDYGAEANTRAYPVHLSRTFDSNPRWQEKNRAPKDYRSKNDAREILAL